MARELDGEIAVLSDGHAGYALRKPMEEKAMNFKPRPLFPKRKLPGGLRLKPENARPSRPIKGAPPLPLDDEMAAEAHRYFAKAALRDMRDKLAKEDL